MAAFLLEKKAAISKFSTKKAARQKKNADNKSSLILGCQKLAQIQKKSKISKSMFLKFSEIFFTNMIQIDIKWAQKGYTRVLKSRATQKNSEKRVRKFWNFWSRDFRPIFFLGTIDLPQIKFNVIFRQKPLNEDPYNTL